MRLTMATVSLFGGVRTGNFFRRAGDWLRKLDTRARTSGSERLSMVAISSMERLSLGHALISFSVSAFVQRSRVHCVILFPDIVIDPR